MTSLSIAPAPALGDETHAAPATMLEHHLQAAHAYAAKADSAFPYQPGDALELAQMARMHAELATAIAVTELAPRLP